MPLVPTNKKVLYTHSCCQAEGAAPALHTLWRMVDHHVMVPLAKPSYVLKQRHFLKDWRKYREMSQNELAAAVRELTGNEKFDRDRVSKIENYNDGMTEDNIYAFAAALNITPGWLFESPESIERQQAILFRVQGRSLEDIDAMLLALDHLKKIPR